MLPTAASATGAHAASSISYQQISYITGRERAQLFHDAHAARRSHSPYPRAARMLHPGVAHGRPLEEARADTAQHAAQAAQAQHDAELLAAQALQAEARRATTGSASAAAAAPNMEPPPQVHMDVHARLLTQIAQQLTVKDFEYEDPSKLLKTVDPAVKVILQGWQKEVRAAFKAAATQKDLSDKYNTIRESSQLMTQLHGEATRQWQFLQVYVMKAVPLDNPQDKEFKEKHAADSSLTYNVLEQWGNMRRRHAQECQNFIIQHQAEQAKLVEACGDPEALCCKLYDQINGWVAANHKALNHGIVEHLHRQTQRFASLVLRQELPKVSSRLKNQQQEERDRQQALSEANNMFEQLNPNFLIGLSCLNAQKPGHFTQQALANELMSKAKRAQTAVTGAKLFETQAQQPKPPTPLQINRHEPLGYLLHGEPSTLEQFGIKINEQDTSKPRATSRSKSQTKASSRGRSQSSNRHSSQQRGRSNSRQSSQSRRSSIPAAQPSRSRGRSTTPRSKTARAQSSQGHSRSSSKRSKTRTVSPTIPFRSRSPSKSSFKSSSTVMSWRARDTSRNRGRQRSQSVKSVRFSLTPKRDASASKKAKHMRGTHAKAHNRGR